MLIGAVLPESARQVVTPRWAHSVENRHADSGQTPLPLHGHPGDRQSQVSVAGFPRPNRKAKDVHVAFTLRQVGQPIQAEGPGPFM